MTSEESSSRSDGPHPDDGPNGGAAPHTNDTPAFRSVSAANAEEPKAGETAAPPSTNATQSAPRPAKSRRRKLRYALVALAAVVIFAPQLGAWLGKGWVARRLSAETHMDLQIRSIGASWWGGIKVRHVDVRTPSGALVARLKELRTQKSAMGLMTAGLEKGKIYIVNPHITVDLSEQSLAELNDAASKIQVDQGLLRRILQPDRDKKVNFVVVDGLVEIRPRGVEEFQTIVRDASPSLRVTRLGGQVSLGIDPGEICQFEVSPTLCDLGLEYILPILAGAVDADGVCHLRLHSFDLDLQNPAATEVSGELFIDSIRAEVDGPLIGKISSMLAQDASQPDGPLTLHLTENCPVEFAVAEGVVHHEGLKFGLPRLLPSLVLQTRGAIAFDQTMDLHLEAVLPFEDMGEGAVLQKLGSPSLSIPIAGTLSAPEIKVGEGQVVKGLVRDVVKSLTDDQVDPAPLLDKIGELGLLQRFRERRAANEREAGASPAEPANSAPSDQVVAPPAAPSDDAAAAKDGDKDDRSGLLQRIRERRRRNRESQDEID